jgi:SAM-dependent methyltransferase
MDRARLFQRLGVEPSIHKRLRSVIRIGLKDARGRPPTGIIVLDAGCGRKSPLVRFRPEITRLVGVDVHTPEPPLPWLDAFAVVDLCEHGAPSPEGHAFDLILSNFTLEHFADPQAALDNFSAWLTPGGTLVVTTVNRRHPFVAAYLGIPDLLRRRLQPLLKESAADAHALVGACNDPTAVAAALRRAGLQKVRVETVPNLARAWGRRRWSFAAGLVGDLLTQSLPSRRSTILAVARRPE